MNDRPELATTGSLRLPNSIRTRSGATFDPHQARWSFHDGVDTISLNFSSLKWAAPNLIECLKFPLAWYAENRSAKQLESLFYGTQRLVEFLGCLHGKEVIEVSATDLINFRATLQSDTEWQLGALASLLKKWHALKVPGISNDAITFLKQVRLKGTRKGIAVLTMDPVDGPFSEVEFQAVCAALNEAYSAGAIVLGDYVLAWLFILLGQRPRQFALLKVCDVVPVTKKDASLEYLLRVPRVKQGMASHRDEFKDRLLTPSIGQLLCSRPCKTPKARMNTGITSESGPTFSSRK